MADDATLSIKQAEQVDHQLVRGIGIPALTANIVSSTIGAGIFVIPATVAAGLGPAAPLAFICCAIAMVLFVTCFAIAGSVVAHRRTRRLRRGRRSANTSGSVRHAISF